MKKQHLLALALASMMAWLQPAQADDTGAFDPVEYVNPLVGTQSTFFSPAKYSLLPQQLRPEELVAGNALIEALKQLNWKVLHSIIPEQNWSDGRWAINHWGMPNQPFYVSGEDFRKPAERGENNVIAMSMNSYHLYMPHVTHWGDNVLSPSHFLRWHRTVESGPEPLRFGNFLRDYLAAAEGREEPFFLIAGFEFGRTFGVRSMTKHNRRGLELVLEAAKRHPVVFATGRDVALYYERHQLAQPEAVFTQRDYLAGTQVAVYLVIQVGE